MQVFQSQNDGGEVEASNIRCKPLGSSKVGEEFTPGYIGHEHVDIQTILEGGEEVDDEGMVHPGEDVALSVDMFNLPELNDQAFAKNLHGKMTLCTMLVTTGTMADKHHLSEGAGTEGTTNFKVGKL